ncbi:MAG: hemerythrin family protein [Candidatus Scalindua sp.]|jgi:hemerythrin-like metal-binding protein|nr:hemerythrin family protein [Candidatus Scalindua sp.]MBT5307666.1 hemerythrin family protein [Candidatus Scalindua sp.]MBT6563419.1 hemerythrin family protein [Candidatus Scalindua sp.]MBT7212879.1 hemerythrin family protein [Candidatus Scalindua sp.]MBT7593244.1 hemerythrin family protein [Candidatus Scalindua sp.]
MIEWNGEHSVGISVIDEKHKEFIDIINKVIVAKQHDNNPEKIEEVLREIIDYAWNHFRDEESYMVEFCYPEYQYHKEEHLDFVHRANSYFKIVTSGNYQILNEILEYLKRWLVNHIQGTDQKYVECFRKNGLK